MKTFTIKFARATMAAITAATLGLAVFAKLGADVPMCGLVFGGLLISVFLNSIID